MKVIIGPYEIYTYPRQANIMQQHGAISLPRTPYGDHIYVRCQGKGCNQSFIVTFKSKPAMARYTNLKFQQLGRKNGWKVSVRGKSYCPNCLKGMKNETKNN